MEFTNPLSNPVFMPVAGATAVVLTLFLAHTLIAERKNLSRLMQTSLFPRWVSSAILAPLAVLGIFCGSLPMTILITALALIGTWEYSKITGLSRSFMPVVYLFAAAVPLTTALAPQLVPAALMVCMLVTGTIAVFQYRNAPAQPSANGAGTATSAQTQIFQHAAMAMLAVCYTPLLSSFAIQISRLEGGAVILLALAASVGFSDTGAFLCGKTFGKRKMAPHVSPNKTWAGAVGNVLGAYAAFVPVMYFLGPQVPLAVMLGLPVLIGAAALMGDLFESVIKRTYGVKDAGTWLPGFGGILDRVDSLLFVLPVSYLVLSLAL